ncbi:hypothetical protein RJ640_009411 [Escallonia rubra]|uniref:Cucumisin n=1 Tax=Escallonia rubra TaxID=112253 RepID=A0AA88QF99_9ASTE|nr:hypothetical protein RJ640_009411 [Escallonia rubra]
MAARIFCISWLLYIICISSAMLSSVNGALDDDRKAYIVYMGDRPKGDISPSSLHVSMLKEILGSEASTSLLYSYKRSFNGFVVKLTEEEKQKVAAMDGVVSVFPNEKKQLHTTRSWDFMGFPQQVNRTTLESDIIIGVLDTGIWPESDSFKDEGFGPPPSKWKGACQTTNFTCNNKIVGARHYRSDGLFGIDDLQSPRDSNGHGTHTASTAAGGLVSTTSLMGLGLGTARGGVPSARIAVYKICWYDGCHDADILAAFDDAIADGVDLISLSVGGSPKDYLRDSIAIGSFHAMKHGILTSASGGNDGPELSTVSNVSPWALTVAASTTDRKFMTKLQLGNNMVFEGVSINTFAKKNAMYPIIYGGAVPNTTANYTKLESRYCFRNSLDSDLVKGKIILCDRFGNGASALVAGAAGTVMRDRGNKDVAYVFPLPATYLGVEDGATVFNYINSTGNPSAIIYKSNEVKDTLAPYVATFSSRGPNTITNDILKPDLTAPGVEILAATSLLSPLSGVKEDSRRVPYTMKSGTSMACPHATAVAAYIKSFHPSWSPAAIKSALMTTAFPLNDLTSPEAELEYGAGHINPLKAVNPGLVYDAGVVDYIKFLCGQGYNTTDLRLVTGDSSTCTKAFTGLVWDLNLPSFALSAVPLQPFNRKFTRTVTNVGSPMSTYRVTIKAPDTLKISVEPAVLAFTSLGQKLPFVVKVQGLIGRTRVSASMVWDDGVHTVRSPIVVIFCISWLLYIICISSAMLSSVNGALDDDRKAYIVYMGDRPKGDISPSSLHVSMLKEILGSEASTSLLYSYKRSFNGFVVKLTEEEKQKVAAMDGVVSVFPNEKKQLHTTRSWDFMGFPQQVNRTTLESDIIIGVLDTGIWPESDSFKDEGFGPPPSKWKGACQTTNFTCNNKIVGARHYRSDGLFGIDDLQSPRDSNGHGTHTASTAAGGLVSTTSLMGLGLGTARGGVPSARIAVYKICWYDGCHDADILAAFDDAIADGVDLISLSVGGSPKDYLRDSIAIGSFHAMKHGILTSASGGNDGPELSTVSNVSPWALTVAASTTDRKFMTKLQLGNNMVFEGVSINTFAKKNAMYPIIYGGAVPNTTANYTKLESRYCFRNSLDSDLVKGKIILCDRFGNGASALVAGAAGTVMRDRGNKDVAYVFPLPATYLGVEDGATVFNYINSTGNPSAIIYKSNEVKDTLAPYVATFSSRGPNTITNDILKPDLTAPGVEILAATSLLSPLSGVKEDSRRVPYTMKSGTSMACPHATAVAAYIKSFHPSWSPAAIKSALMTTAFPLNDLTSPEAELEYGAGHINPLKAMNPGLVYDAGVVDYIKFLCGQGYNTTDLRLVTGDSSTCTKAFTGLVWDLNLPSFALSAVPLQPFNRKFTRTVTNVGSPMSTYRVTIKAPDTLKISVEPAVLAFTSLGQKLPFVVKVQGLIGRTRVSASMVWDDGVHTVRSPIVVYGF